MTGPDRIYWVIAHFTQLALGVSGAAHLLSVGSIIAEPDLEHLKSDAEHLTDGIAFFIFNIGFKT